MFTQPPVERLLRTRVAQLPDVTVALGTTLTALAQQADGVTLTLQAEGEAPRSVHASWLIGCDGGSSTVRSLTGRLKAAGAIICERDATKARARDARLLAECQGVVQDTRARTCCPGWRPACWPRTTALAAASRSAFGVATPDPPNDAYFGTDYDNQHIGFNRYWLFLQCSI